ncbi:putative ribosomal protein S5 domain 2-type [Helianthus debilis subsp. tardiflorus]
MGFYFSINAGLHINPTFQKQCKGSTIYPSPKHLVSRTEGGAAAMEYVSPEGLRLDGRRPMEMRQLRAELGAVSRADG